ncbi:MAG TPA: hypothetical protein VK427_11255 [Kofleriaceae bacterium]|nr:hypothetical protein [Kofleriaceae bacterium]
MRNLVLVALLAGCYRESAAPRQPVAPRAEQHARAASDPLAFLEGDAVVVMGIDLARLRTSPLWPRIEPLVDAKLGATVARFQAACGFDPIARLRHVAFSTRDYTQDPVTGVVVLRGLARTELEPCLVKTLGRERVTARDADIVVVGGSAIAFAGAQTIVFASGPSATLPRMRALLDGGASLRRNPQFMEAYDRVDTTRDSWWIMNGPNALQPMQALGVAAQDLVGWIDAASGVTAKLTLRMPSAADAANLATMAQPYLQLAQTMTQRLEVTAVETAVVVDVAMTDEQVVIAAGLLGL